MNQQRQVVEEVHKFGKPYHFGLEAGSAELLAVVALADNTTPIICNGFKDAEFIETAMLGHQIGRNIIPSSRNTPSWGSSSTPRRRSACGRRSACAVKLAARGSGRWQSSGGFRSKFGLTVTEIMRGLEELKSRGMQDCLKLLHFHLGSQITNIRIVKGALNEAARVYTELAKLGAGSSTSMSAAARRGLRRLADELRVEHELHARGGANDVVYHIQTVCDEAGVNHPDDRLRERSRRRRVPQHAGVQRPGCLGFGDEKVPTTANSSGSSRSPT